ncbi:MAG: Abi family protein [Prevotellaceae bacterium]|nr:Abi family protein [Prevotellaceae bacterium]MDO4931533.1 Abi family protein [Prevotellaceae bacterium]
MKYTKQYSSPAELVELLKRRGLDFSDVDNAEAAIWSIGYYRLSGYLYPLLAAPKSEHRYKKGSTFGNALSLYEFDRELRLLVLNQIERIEIAVRSAVANIICEETGDIFWMTNRKHFVNTEKFDRTISLIDKELQSTHEDFIIHFKHTYEESYPPSWMLTEILPLGTLTRVYENIADNKIRKRIAKSFGLTVPVFMSWMTVITLTRNSCCHHARLWNRYLSLRTLVMTRPLRPWISDGVRQGRIFFTLCILKHFVDIVWEGNSFKQDLMDLLGRYPMVDIHAMGFPSTDWTREPLWYSQQ